MVSVGSSFRLPIPIGRVWRLLVDIERYGDWHPTLRFTARPGDDRRVDYIYAPRAAKGPQLSGEGRIVNLDWLSGFAWRTGTRGILVIEESYRLEKTGHGVEITHHLSCSGLFSWLGYPFFRRAFRIFLKRADQALEQRFRKISVQTRYARPSGARR